MEGVRNDDGFEINVRYLLTKLFSIICTENSGTITERTKKESAGIERSKAMLGYIKSHFPEDITLQDIAYRAAAAEKL